MINNFVKNKENIMSSIEIQTISPKNLKIGDLILDVRTYEEISEKVLAMPFIHEDSSTINIDECIKKYNLNGKKTLNVLCLSGKRATEVAKKFIAKGYNNVKVIDGGILEAEKEGLQVINKN